MLFSWKMNPHAEVVADEKVVEVKGGNGTLLLFDCSLVCGNGLILTVSKLCRLWERFKHCRLMHMRRIMRERWFPLVREHSRSPGVWMCDGPGASWRLFAYFVVSATVQNQEVLLLDCVLGSQTHIEERDTDFNSLRRRR